MPKPERLGDAQRALTSVNQRLAEFAQRTAPAPQQPPQSRAPSASAPQATLSPPGPFSLSATTRCSGALPGVLLSWSASPGAKTYALVRNGQVYRDYTCVGTSLTFLNQEVTGGTRYTYVVRAKNEAGQTRDSNSVAIVAPVCRRLPIFPVAHRPLLRQSVNGPDLAKGMNRPSLFRFREADSDTPSAVVHQLPRRMPTCHNGDAFRPCCWLPSCCQVA